MKSHIKHLLTAMVLLILLDQGIKLLVERTIPQSESLMQVSDTFHLHPYINNENMTVLFEKATESGVPLWLYVAGNMAYKLFGSALTALALCALSSFCSHLCGGKQHTLLLLLQSALLLSAAICNCICMLLRGGSLDFLCFAENVQIPYGDHFHTVPHHTIFDFKDLYLCLSFVLTVWLVIRLLADIAKCLFRHSMLPKDERKAEARAMKERARSWFKTVLQKEKASGNREIPRDL